jgi:flagellar motor switch protein FliM
MSDESPKPAEASLAPAEVAKLIDPAGEPAAPPQKFLRATGRRGESTGRVLPHNFRNPSFLSEGELRRLRLLHDDFVGYLAARLSLHLRMEFGLKLTQLTTATFGQFTEALVNPTHLSLFKAEPLVGVGILGLAPRLGLALADRLLGGRGLAGKSERSLTEIEIALLEDLIVIVLEEWCALWKPDPALRPHVIGHESNGRFLQTSPKDAIVLALTLEASFGDCSAPLQIGVPYYLIEPLVKKIQARRQPEPAAAAPEKRTTWQPAYDRITLPLRAEWANLEFTLRELTCLRVGDVIEMPASLFQETRVLLNGTPKFIGRVGHEADRVVVQLTRKLPPEETTHVHHPDGRKNP